MNDGEKNISRRKKPNQHSQPDKKRPRIMQSPKKMKKDSNGEFQWKKAARTLSFWVFLIAGSILLSQIFRFDQAGEQSVSYSQYVKFLEEGKIAEAKIIDLEFHGSLKEEEISQQSGKSVKFRRFKVLLPFKNG